LYFVPWIWVFNQFIALPDDKKVVGVFVRFRASFDNPLIQWRNLKKVVILYIDLCSDGE
jgi:hypothetical protein